MLIKTPPHIHVNKNDTIKLFWTKNSFILFTVNDVKLHGYALFRPFILNKNHTIIKAYNWVKGGCKNDWYEYRDNLC